MGDVRFREAYARIQTAGDRAQALRALSDDEVIAALAHASQEQDRLLANVLATEAFNRMRRSGVIARSVGEAVLGFDANGYLNFANPSAEQLLGAQAADLWHRRWFEIIGRGELDPAGCPVVRVIEEGRAIVDQEEVLRPPARDPFWAEWGAYPVEHDGEVQGVIMLFRDISARKVEEARRAARHEITGRLARSASISEAAPDLLRIIGETFAWDAGALWVMREDRLVCQGFWSAEGIDLRAFEKTTREIALAPGQGVPGRIWETCEPFWTSDLSTLDAARFPRSAAARADGLNAVFAFPCPVDRRPLAIIDFYSRSLKSPDEALMSMVEGIGSEVGSFVERRLSEARLRDSEARKSGILHASLDAIVTIDAEGRIVEFNAAAERLFGYTAEEIMGEELYETIVPTRFREAHRAGMARYLRTREARILGRRIELPALRKDGVEIVVELYIVPVPNPDKLLFTSAMRDVTERRAAEDALRESEERFRATFEQAAIGLAHVAIDGRWLRVNQRLCDILGYEARELTTMTFQEVSHPEDLGADLMEVERLLRGDIDTYELDKRYVRKDGSHVPVHITVSLVRNALGAPHYFIGAVQPRQAV